MTLVIAFLKIKCICPEPPLLNLYYTYQLWFEHSRFRNLLTLTLVLAFLKFSIFNMNFLRLELCKIIKLFYRQLLIISLKKLKRDLPFLVKIIHCFGKVVVSEDPVFTLNRFFLWFR